MKKRLICSSLALTLVLTVAASFCADKALAANPTRIEWEDANSPLAFNGVNYDGDFTANLSVDHVANKTNADIGWAFSNGYAHEIGAGWATPGPQTHLNFAGTGIRFRALRYGGGNDTIDWSIQSALGQVVKSGTVNLNGNAENVDVTCAAQGELPLGLYRLVIDPGFGGVGVAELDYAEVYDNALTRVEAEGYYAQTAGTWGTDANWKPSGGKTLWSNAQNDTISVSFNGTGIAVVNPFSASGYGGLGTFEWSIDGVVGGTINLSDSRYAGFSDSRVSTILANNLAAGSHTLVCKITTSGKPVMFDAFDIVSAQGNALGIYEAEDTNSPLSANGVNHDRDFVANLSSAHKNDIKPADLGVDYSHGFALGLADSWPAPGMGYEFNFSGKSVTASLLQYGNAESEVNWQLLGANNAVVSSGVFNANGNLARPGLTVTAPTPGLYKLRLTGGTTVSGQLTVIDYFQVAGDTLTRMEDGNAMIHYRGAGWVQGDTFLSPSGGTMSVNSTPGEWLAVEFNGTDIAVVTPFNINMGTFNWTIDNGEGGSGTINQSASRFAPVDFTDTHVSTILAKGLADGHHRLILTVAEGNTKNVYIDAFDTNGSFITAEVPVELSSFNAE